MASLHWNDLSDMSSAIVDMGLNIMIYKGYTWKRVWAFLMDQANAREILPSKDSIYFEYLRRGGIPLEDIDESDDSY